MECWRLESCSGRKHLKENTQQKRSIKIYRLPEKKAHFDLKGNFGFKDWNNFWL